MKKIIVCLILIIIIVFSLFISCKVEKEEEPHDLPVKWEYNPKKAGVEVLVNEEILLNAINLPIYPKLAKDKDYIYIYDGNRIFILNNDLTTDNIITIDPIIDLSIDVDVYEATGNYYIISHDNKIVISNYFAAKDSNTNTNSLFTLQMDRNGNNRKLIKFSEFDRIYIIAYNFAKRRMIVDSGSKIGEYIYMIV